MASKHWISQAISHPGRFTEKAKKAGMSVQEYAARVLSPHSKASAKLRREAQLAITLSKLGARRQRG